METPGWQFGAFNHETVVDEGWGTSDWAIVATNKGYWDALSAAGVAGLLKAPVLMTAPDKLSYATRTTLKGHNTKHVVIAGGTAAVSDKVASQIRSMGISVERVRGGNAVGTSRAMYRFGLKHGGWSTDAIVATSDGFQDALSAAPYAYASAAPIFLTTLKKKTLTGSVVDDIKSGGFTRTLICGGKAAVAKSVDEKVPGAKRLKGGTAYETSRKIAEFSLSEGMGASHMGIATGRGYWDALSGAALLGKKNSVILLADDKNSSSAATFIKEHRSGLGKGCYIFGGTSAVSESALGNALGTASENADTSSQTVYVTKTGKKYHAAGCKYLKDSKISISLNEAKKKYTPCSVCWK